MSIAEALTRLYRWEQRIRRQARRVRISLDVWTPEGTRAVTISTGPWCHTKEHGRASPFASD